MTSKMAAIKLILLSTVLSAAAVPSAFAGEKPQPAQTPATEQTPGTRTVNGLKLEPDGGSGPDKSKFNIVSEKEAKRQQGQLKNSGGSSTTSDGTGEGGTGSGR